MTINNSSMLNDPQIVSNTHLFKCIKQETNSCAKIVNCSPQARELIRESWKHAANKQPNEHNCFIAAIKG